MRICPQKTDYPFVPGSKVAVLGMVIQPLIGNPYNGYINPYYWVDDHPLLYGSNGSLDPSTFDPIFSPKSPCSIPRGHDIATKNQCTICRTKH